MKEWGKSFLGNSEILVDVSHVICQAVELVFQAMVKFVIWLCKMGRMGDGGKDFYLVVNGILNGKR